MDDESKCPVVHSTEGRSNRDWWPDELDLRKLQQNPPMGNPMGEDFSYAEEFKTLDLDALRSWLYESAVQGYLRTRYIAWESNRDSRHMGFECT